MREIKFRAYARNSEVMVHQKDFNKWIDDFIMHVEFKPWEDDETEFIAEYIWVENDDETHSMNNPPIHSTDDMVEVMQYTGLKDKNGTEIYEGDYFQDGLYTWEVYFQDSCFVAKCLNGPFGVECLDEFMDFETPQYCDVEIIGNIYENPELLEVE